MPQNSPSTPHNGEPTFSVSTHAAQAMASRGITAAQLRNAILHGTARSAKEPGREVIRDGNLRVVVERGEQSVEVLTAMYADDLAS